MTDRPILFSGPMVRAILREIECPGTGKTQTRRVLKPQFPREVDSVGYTCFTPPRNISGRSSASPGAEWFRKLPYAIGDRLWVREGHALVGAVDPQWVLYRANGYEAECRRHGFDTPYPTEPRWRPSLHMPRWASRLTLTVTDVRVERVQDISEADAIAEGFGGHPDPIGALALLWDSLNAARGYGWDANPWVVARTFTAEQRNIDAGVEA